MAEIVAAENKAVAAAQSVKEHGSLVKFSLFETLPPRCCVVSLIRLGLIRGGSVLRFTEDSKIEKRN